MTILTASKFGAGEISQMAEYNEKGECLSKDGQSLTSGPEDYFIESPDTLMSEICGSGAAHLGLGVVPQEGDFTAIFHGYNPRNDEDLLSKVRRGQLDKDPSSIAGFAMSFNLDKSFSVLYAAVNSSDQQALGRCAMNAARLTIEWAEEQGILSTRRSSSAPADLGEAIRNINNGVENGSRMEKVKAGVISLNYLHFTSRALDPHAHVHVNLANLALAEDGKWTTLEAGEIYRRQTELAAVFDGFMHEETQRDVPHLAELMSVDYDRNGLVVPCIPDDLIKKFSKRANKIKEVAKESGLVGAAAKRAINKATRDGKTLVDAEKLRASWKAEIGDLELSPGKISAPTKLLLEQLIFKNKSVFRQIDLDRAAAQLAICHGGPKSIPAIKSEIMLQMGVICMPSDSKGPIYTTKDFLTMESDLARFAVKSRARNQAYAVSRETAEAAIAETERLKGFSLRDEQKNAIYLSCGDAQGSVIDGAAGTGKSQSAFGVRLAHEMEGWKVVGLAPSGSAGAELQSSAEIEDAMTIHSLLVRLESDGPKPEKIDPKTLFVVDEAGMADTRTMHKLLGHIDAAGAKYVLAGDAKQLEAVGSASTYSMMADVLETANLIQIARQKDPDDCAISQAWFDGDDAVSMMKARGLFRTSGEGKDTAINQMLAYTAEVHSLGIDWDEILLLADRRAQVRELNERVRDLRFQLGELDAEAQHTVPVTNKNGRQIDLDLAPGDRIMLRKSGKIDDIKVFNGDRATLLGISRIEIGENKKGEMEYEYFLNAKLDRKGDDGEKIKLSWKLSDYNVIEHCYSVTVHKSQGLSLDYAPYLGSAMSSRSLAYVAYTRARNGSPVFLNADEVEDFIKNTAEFTAKITALDADPELKARIIADALAFKDAFHHSQPKTQEVLEKSGETFVYPGEDQKPALTTPEIIVGLNTKNDIALALASGCVVGELIDLPDDTVHKPGKPYDLPNGFEKAYLTAKPVLENNQEKIDERRQQRELGYAARSDRDEQRELTPGAGRDAGESASAFGIVQLDRERIQELRAAGARGKVYDDKSDPFSAFRPPTGHELRFVSGGDLASSGGREAGGLLPNYVQGGDREAVSVRRASDGRSDPSGVKDRPMAKRFDKAADARDIANWKRDVSLVSFAENNGFLIDTEKSAAKYKSSEIEDRTGVVVKKGADQIDIYLSKSGEWAWYVRSAGEGGDIYKFAEKFAGAKNFAESKELVSDFSGGKREQLTSEESQEKERAREQIKLNKEKLRASEIEAGTKKAYGAYKLMKRQGGYLESRGISPEVLAETRWKSNRYGSAIFPHVNAQEKFTGYEYRGAGPEVNEDGDLKQFKGYCSKANKGVYIANPKIENPSEIRLSEAGLDTLSAYELATPEERKTVLFVSTAGEPGPGTYEAVEALIKKHEVEKVSLAYDRDKGGNHLTEKVRAHLVEKHQELMVNDVREDMGMQPGEDANDLLRRIQAERLQQIQREADREPPAVAGEEVIQTASAEQTAPVQTEPNDDQPQPEAGKPHSVGQEGALEVEDEEQQYEYYSGFELDD